MVNLSMLLLTAVLSANGEAVLLQFTAEGCRPCQQMIPTVQRLEEEGYPIQRVDMDRNPQAAREWRVNNVPCFILVRNGQEVDRVEGPASHDRLTRLFDRAGTPSPRPSRTRPATIIRGQSPDGFAGSQDLDASRREPPAAGPTAALGVPRERVAERELPGGRSGLDRELTSRGDALVESQPEAMGLAASVRIKVSDGDGTSYGTGTIIDTHRDEALVVTCGHLFRDSQGNGEIIVELLAPDASGRSVRGEVIEWDADDRDIALLVIRPGMPVTPAPVASSLEGLQRGTPVFSIGCNHGGAPTTVRSTVADVDRYINAPNIVVAGQPVDGRSGGGLFSGSGELIGICNAADPTDNEGIYAGLRTIHEQLDRIGMSRIYAPDTEQFAVTHPAGVPLDRERPLGRLPETFPESNRDSIDELDRSMIAPTPMKSNDFADSHAVPLSELVGALEEGHEVICIIRTPNQKDARVVFLDEDSRQLLSQLAPRKWAPLRDGRDDQTASQTIPTQWRE